MRSWAAASSIRSDRLVGQAAVRDVAIGPAGCRHQSPSVMVDAWVQLIAFFEGRARISPRCNLPTRFAIHTCLEAAVEGGVPSPP